MWKFWNNKGDKRADEDIVHEEMNEDFGTQDASKESDAVETSEEFSEENAAETTEDNSAEISEENSIEDLEETTETKDTSKSKKGSFWKWLGFGRDSEDTEDRIQ